MWGTLWYVMHIIVRQPKLLRRHTINRCTKTKSTTKAQVKNCVFSFFPQDLAIIFAFRKTSKSKKPLGFFSSSGQEHIPGLCSITSLNKQSTIFDYHEVENITHFLCHSSHIFHTIFMNINKSITSHGQRENTETSTEQTTIFEFHICILRLIE